MKLSNIIPTALTEAHEVNKKGLKMYLVGGAVRDKLLGKTPKDLDYVVVGATPEEMEKRGFSQVGADFPVFLDDKGDEYALARTERKTGKGYKGFETSFDPNTSLEDDLARRDLTINAMAQDLDTGEIIDPFGGQKDLKNKVLRHVSDAFAEDPVRVLRTARFASRYGFTVAPETKKLMRQLSDSGELDSLTVERVWKEISRAMMEPTPQAFAQVMHDANALGRVFGEMGTILHDSYHVLRTLAKHNANERQRWMGVALNADSSILDKFVNHHKVPNDVATPMKFVKKIQNVDFSSVDSVVEFLNNTRLWNNSSLLKDYAEVIDWLQPSNKFNFDKLLTAVNNAAKISFNSLSDKEKESLSGPEIGDAISAKRAEIIRQVYSR